jgi:hypothetical protein
MRRFPILVVFGGLLAAGLVVDRDRPAPAEVVFGTATAPVQPIAPPASAATTTWFCPGMPAPADGTTAGFVTMANPTDTDLPATLTVVPSEGVAAKRSMTLAAHTTTSVNVAEVAPAAWAAAQVDIVGGGAVVEQSVAKGEIRDPSACATATAPTWYSANGVTTRDATVTYLVFNPYPDDAIVDMDFATNEGRFAPQPLQGLVVRGGSVRAVDVTEQVRRRTSVAGTITARSGRVVVGRLQTYDGTAGPEGYTWGLAAPSTATEWLFPDGRRVPQVSERVVVYNPGPDAAEVDIEVRPPLSGEEDDAALATLQSLTVSPFSATAYDVTGDATVADGAHSIVVSSANGVPIVAERVTNLVADSGTRGVSSMLGSRVAAREWLLATGATTDAVVEELTVLNDGSDDASVTVSSVDADGVTALGDPLTVPAGGFVQVKLNDLVEQTPLTVLVESDTPVVVERGLVFKGQNGTSRQLGVPLS